DLDRAARLVAQHAVDPTLPGLEEIIDALTKATFDAVASTAYEAEVRRAEERVLVDRLTWVATASPNAQVRAIATHRLSRLAARARAGAGKSEADQAHLALMAADIRRFLERPLDLQRPVPVPPPDAPPGAPIGDEGMHWLARPPYSRFLESADAWWCNWPVMD
ncbi:MAG: hypothetical protein HY654_11110, partial [Acidobacteria bacterium]|nr:hypothetical protein [Acidobacteriota bacterium]